MTIVSERCIEWDTAAGHREIGVRTVKGGEVVLSCEDTHTVAIVQMEAEHIAALVDALAPHLPAVDETIGAIAVRSADSFTTGPGDGFRDGVLLTVAERDALVAAAAGQPPPPAAPSEPGEGEEIYRTAVAVIVQVVAADLEEAAEKLHSTSTWHDWEIDSEVQWARGDSSELL